MDIYQTLQKELNSKVVKNELLANHTTFKIGGPAKYFFTAKSKEDVIKAIKVAKELDLAFFILGKGSNLLVSDRGFDGLVIEVRSNKLEVRSERIVVEAGVELAKLVSETTKAGLSSLEFLAGIPGTVGAAVYGNVGAFGEAMGDIVKSVTVLKDNNKLQMTNDQCRFSYRSSIFKTTKDIILEAELKLSKGSKEEIKKQVNEYLSIRREKFPPCPSAGSVFKNIELRTLNKKLKTLFKENAKGGKIATGWLIEQCGLKGLKVGGAEISEQHANFIINRDGAKAKDVLKLMDLIKKKVHDKFGIELKEEIQII